MMTNDIPKPEISPAFTIDDIHKIREWNYERQKDMSISERMADNECRLQIALKRRVSGGQRETAGN